MKRVFETTYLFGMEGGGLLGTLGAGRPPGAPGAALRPPAGDAERLQSGKEWVKHSTNDGFTLYRLAIHGFAVQ